MKKIYTIFILLLIILNIISIKVYAASTNYPTGTAYYGSTMQGYTIIENDNSGWVSKQPFPWTRIYKTNQYYTYYVKTKMHIKTSSLSQRTYKRINSSNYNLIGSYENTLFDFTYETTDGFDLSVPFGSGVSLGVSFTNHQTWNYILSEGEEVTFNLVNCAGEYVGIAVVELEIYVLKRICKVEKIYKSNGDYISATQEIVYQDYWVPFDYDLFPVYYDDLTYSESNRFTKTNNETYFLNEIQILPNYSDDYYNLIPQEYRQYYYYG